MQIAVISDTHFGDPSSKLASDDGSRTKAYGAFKKAIFDFTNEQPLNYLVLAGDILDFSIASFAEACAAARPFFDALRDDKICKEIIYIPGNHDKHIWDTVEWETSIVAPMRQHKLPKDFPGTQPAIIDFTAGNLALNLPGVRYSDPMNQIYGDIFLKGLFSERPLPVSVAYPNLYLKTPADNYIITHGHMLEFMWVLISELFSNEPEIKKTLSLKELEQYNVPLTSMICTGVGQAGDVTDIFRKVEKEAYEGKTDRLHELIKTSIIPYFVEKIIFWDALEKKVLNKLFDSFLDRKQPKSRYRQDFMKDESIRKRFLKYFESTLMQTRQLGVEKPSQFIFGHTHEPIPATHPWSLPEQAGLPFPINIYNTGGWLDYPNKSAEVMLIDDQGYMTSKNIK